MPRPCEPDVDPDCPDDEPEPFEPEAPPELEPFDEPPIPAFPD